MKNGGIMSNVYRDRTTYKTFNVSFLIVVIGSLLLFFVSRLEFLNKYPEWQSLIKDFGSLCVASVGVAIIWELFSKRAFMSELLTTTKLADEIQASGLIRISSKWHGEVDWTNLFRKSDEINLFFMYGRTWRNINRAEIQNFIRRVSTKATIILPDVENVQFLGELARSISVTPDELKNRIEEAKKEFIAMFDAEENAAERFAILSTSVFPVYSLYQFDGTIIVTFYSLDKSKKEVPTFVFEKGGSLFNFFMGDLNSLKQSAACRKIYPVEM